MAADNGAATRWCLDAQQKKRDSRCRSTDVCCACLGLSAWSHVHAPSKSNTCCFRSQEIFSGCFSVYKASGKLYPCQPGQLLHLLAYLAVLQPNWRLQCSLLVDFARNSSLSLAFCVFACCYVCWNSSDLPVGLFCCSCHPHSTKGGRQNCIAHLFSPVHINCINRQQLESINMPRGCVCAETAWLLL